MNAKIVLFAATAALSLSSCSSSSGKTIFSRAESPSGEIVSKTLDLTGFSGIDASHAVKVVYTQAPVFKVELRGPSDVMELAEVSVKGKTLYVGIDNMANFSFSGDDTRLWAFVSAPSVTNFDASSASSVTVSGDYSAEGDVEIDVSSSGSVNFASLVARGVDIEGSSSGSVTVAALRASGVSVDVSSSAYVSLAGEASQVDLEASSSATIMAGDLRARTGSASASSSASVRSSIRSVEIHESSSGTVRNSK